jgi:hexokinase
MYTTVKLNQTELQQVYRNFITFLNTEPLTLTQFPRASFVALGETYQVMIMGGTHFLSGIFEVTNTGLFELSRVQEFMKVFKTREDVGDFFLENLNLNVTKVVLNFTFPMQSIIRDGTLDGRLLRATKGYNFQGLIGHNVGEFLEKYVYTKTGKIVKIMVINDLLPLAHTTTADKQETLAVIVGTGLNIGFWRDENILVEVEPEQFQDYPHLFPDQPDITGNNLYHLYNQLCSFYNWPTIDSTEQLNDIATMGKGDQQNIAKELFERSASLVACMIAGIMNYKKVNNATLAVEGSLFWHGYNYQTNMLYYLGIFGVSPENVKICQKLDPLKSTSQMAIDKNEVSF